jgi:hypothetical protein
MTKNQEDTMYEIHQDVKSRGIRKKFDKQLKKMSKQSKHKYKDVVECWEYAYNKIK